MPTKPIKFGAGKRRKNCLNSQAAIVDAAYKRANQIVTDAKQQALTEVERLRLLLRLRLNAK